MIYSSPWEDTKACILGETSNCICKYRIEMFLKCIQSILPDQATPALVQSVVIQGVLPWEVHKVIGNSSPDKLWSKNMKFDVFFYLEFSLLS